MPSSPCLPSTPREFEPVGNLAQALGDELKIPALPGALVKTRTTKPQKEMTALAQKQANVRGAFALQGELRGKRILLVDDLYDSGATLQEAARVSTRRCCRYRCARADENNSFRPIGNGIFLTCPSLNGWRWHLSRVWVERRREN